MANNQELSDLKLLLKGALIIVGVMGWVLAIMFWRAPAISLDRVEYALRSPEMAGDTRVPCRPPTDREKQRDVLSLEALRTFRPGDQWSYLMAASISHFAQDQFGSTFKDRICPDVDLYDDVADAAIRAGTFSGKFIAGGELNLAHRLGPKRPEIMDAVLRTAFYPDRIASSDDPDVRNTARVILADFCLKDAKVTTDASRRMSAGTQSGRAAARVAIACGDLGALPVVSGWMKQVLDQAGRGIIDRNTRDVLYELAYAIEVAGPKAQPYDAPVSDLLDRKVQSWAPPYGMITYSPVRMCVVAERIGGALAEKAAGKKFCREPRTLDQ